MKKKKFKGKLSKLNLNKHTISNLDKIKGGDYHTPRPATNWVFISCPGNQYCDFIAKVVFTGC